MFDERQLPAGLRARMADFSPDSFRYTHVLGVTFIPIFSSRKLGDMYWVKIYTSIDKKHNIDIGLHLPILASFKLFLTTFEYKI